MMSPNEVLHVVSQSYFRGQSFSALKMINVLGLRHICYPEYVFSLSRI
jgi:hypothetical protein